MPQAKGILPRREDKDILYKNPRTCGYFISVKFGPQVDRSAIANWFHLATAFVNELVAKLPADDGSVMAQRVAAVAVGLGMAFFDRAAGFDPPIRPPAGFRGQPDAPMPHESGPLAAVAMIDADVMFYVASVFEARVSNFVNQLWSTRPLVQRISIDRGYQREDNTEPFGYRDGLRNIRWESRSHFVFVHRDDRHVEEPRWADGGSYMAIMKIVQNLDVFNALPDDVSRDAIIGRRKDGIRLDLVAPATAPRDEPSTPLPQLPPGAHVGKAGPRGRHDDTQIFRRGMPFLESTGDGALTIGLLFCSFQASLDQFDIAFNDWLVNPRFPSDGAGVDALLDPARGLTTLQKVGFFFVPPHDNRFLAATLFDAEIDERGTTGRLAVRKRVTDPSDPGRRFERGGFVFQIVDSQGQPVGGEFESDSTGRAVSPVPLVLGQTYKLREVKSPVMNVTLTDVDFKMDKRHKELPVTNTVTQPNTPYGQ